MTKSVILPNGHRVVVLGIAEATERLDCSIEQLGEWIAAGQIYSCQCVGCGCKYPVQADVEDLLQFAEQFPAQVPLDEIVEERVKHMSRRGQRQTREVDTDPRAKKVLPPQKGSRTTQAYQGDDSQKRTLLQRLPGRR